MSHAETIEKLVNEADLLNLVDPETLRDALGDYRGQRGVGRLRTVLDPRSFRRTRSGLERRFLRLVKRAGLPIPLTREWVSGFETDFFWPDLGLVVETDGFKYHRTAARQARDRRRDQAHTKAGLTHLRFTEDQIDFEVPYVLETLRTVAGRLGSRSGGLGSGRGARRLSSRSMAELPKSVRIREVGPRDGFQNEPETISTADKVRLIDMLSASGLSRLEVTSFVRPDVIPQLADAEQVLAAIERREGVSFSVLIPNERGLERALEMRERFDEINVFLSASETHNRKNVNRSIEESLTGLEATLARAGEAGLRCEGVISTSFGCPYEGEVPAERVFEIAERLAAAGCEEVGFGDTTGMANPRQVAGVLRRRPRAPHRGRADRALPQHPRPGPGQRPRRARGGGRLLRGELRRARRLPGARRARPATSPARTWSRCWRRWASSTGVDLARLVEASRAAQEVLGRPLGAHVLRAGPVDWHRG